MTAAIEALTGIEHQLRADYGLLPQSLCLQLLDYRLAIRSNSAALLARLQTYFAHVVQQSCDHARAEVIAIECDTVDIGLAFVDWKREPGKTGRKDAIHDFEGGRLVSKVRTGMVFLQSERALIAAGPCLAHQNQVVNFINSQFLNWLQQDGYLLCHAAALSRRGQGLGIAAFSGGGKSTLMLNLLEDAATAYVSNDRLLVRRQADAVHAVGIPKLPRINPGTIVNNTRLFSMIATRAREELLKMDKNALWQLEQKYDVDISERYGPGRIRHETILQQFLVLNWRHDATESMQLSRVDLAQRPDLLAAIMKPSGPFYVDAAGRFNSDDAMPDEAAYRAALAPVAVYEATGRIDFERLGSLCRDELMV